jgi:hypothetical protein
MDQDEMTEQDYAANKAAVYYPPVDGFFNNEAYAPPCIEIDGAQGYFYVQDGVLQLSVDLDGAGDAFDKYKNGKYECVPLVVRVNGATVFEATQLTDLARAIERMPHEDTLPVLVRTGRKRGIRWQFWR